jgi:trk system potassium uptake protein TrkH
MSSDKVQLFSYFLVICFLGSLLLSCPFAYAAGTPVPYIDALFVSVSAVCVTGLSSVDMNIFSNAGFIIIMSLIELGGLGIIIFISFYVAVPKRKMSLVNRTVLREYFSEDVETEPRKILKSILFFTLSIESMCALILFFQFKKEGSSRPLLDALFHSVSAFCNAGFSTYQKSLCSFVGNYVIETVIMVLIVSGGIGFIVLTDIVNRMTKHDKRRLSFHSRMVLAVTGVLIVGGAFLFYIVERNGAFAGLSEGEKIFASFFSSITPRTAGFSVVPQTSFSPVMNLITSVFMFIGGSPGSIAGGIKTTTFTIVLIYALRGNSERTGLTVNGRNLDTAIIEKSFSIAAKSILILVISLGFLVCTERVLLASGKYSVFDLFFESVSAFGTVGLSLGVTSSLSMMGKAVIIATMFIGRTGIFAMALGFAHSDKERFFEYPSANVLVG